MCEASPEEAELIAELPSSEQDPGLEISCCRLTILQSFDAAWSPEELQDDLTNMQNEFFSFLEYLLLTGRSGFNSLTLRRFLSNMHNKKIVQT